MSTEVKDILSGQERRQAILDCAAAINDCQKDLLILKSSNNPLLYGELIEEVEDRLRFFLQIRRELRNGTKAEK